MKRNKFIASLLTLAATPQLVFSQIQNKLSRKDKTFKVNAGEGRIHGHIKLKGVNSNIPDVKISGSDTDRDLAIFEQTSLSPGMGTPLHIHHFQDELFMWWKDHIISRLEKISITLLPATVFFYP